jgi:hypothetical protein
VDDWAHWPSMSVWERLDHCDSLVVVLGNSLCDLGAVLIVFALAISSIFVPEKITYPSS